MAWYGVTFGSVVTPALSRTEREFVAEVYGHTQDSGSVLPYLCFVIMRVAAHEVGVN